MTELEILEIEQMIKSIMAANFPTHQRVQMVVSLLIKKGCVSELVA